MTYLETTLARFERVMEMTGEKPSPLSIKVFKCGKRYKHLKHGGSCTMRTLDRANDVLSELERSAEAA